MAIKNDVKSNDESPFDGKKLLRFKNPPSYAGYSPPQHGSLPKQDLGVSSTVKFNIKDEEFPPLPGFQGDLKLRGLNWNRSEDLYGNFSSPWSDEPSKNDPEFTVPQCHLVEQRPVLHESYSNNFLVNTLFYVFYRMPNDEAQLYSVNELHNRGWFYHKGDRLWYTRIPNTEPLVKTNAFERGSYYFFDPDKFEIVQKDDFELHYEMLEERPALPKP